MDLPRIAFDHAVYERLHYALPRLPAGFRGIVIGSNVGVIVFFSWAAYSALHWSPSVPQNGCVSSPAYLLAIPVIHGSFIILDLFIYALYGQEHYFRPILRTKGQRLLRDWVAAGMELFLWIITALTSLLATIYKKECSPGDFGRFCYLVNAGFAFDLIYTILSAIIVVWNLVSAI